MAISDLGKVNYSANKNEAEQLALYQLEKMLLLFLLQLARWDSIRRLIRQAALNSTVLIHTYTSNNKGFWVSWHETLDLAQDQLHSMPAYELRMRSYVHLVSWRYAKATKIPLSYPRPAETAPLLGLWVTTIGNAFHGARNILDGKWLSN